MNKTEKIALKELKNNKIIFDRKKQQQLLSLLNNIEYKQLHLKEKHLIMQASLSEDAQILKDLKNTTRQKELLGKTIQTPYLQNNEYMCNKCKDKGYVNQLPCTCLKQIMSDILIRESGILIDTEYLNNSNFKMFENKAKVEKFYKLTLQWCDSFKESKIINWGFFGHTGTGKTHLMLVMAKKLIENGNFIFFTTAFNMIQDLLKQHTNFEDKDKNYLSKYLDCEVLFIDDLGTEPKYQNVNENYLYLILNQRMIENKPVVFSSNFDLNQFEDFYGERIFSRLLNKRVSKALLFDGEDIRLKKEEKV